MLYRVRPGDSPTIIARTYSVPFDALIAANPHKATTVVDGIRTWTELFQNEEIKVPVGGIVGSPATDAINALLASSGPCDPANVSLVCAVQRAIGVSPDGKYGNDTATAARAYSSAAPPGCSPRPSWWAPKGQSNCPAAPAPSSGSSLLSIAQAAEAALNADPNYCTSVGHTGTAVNTTIHNFKVAWNAAYPNSPVPVGTGKYEDSVAASLASVLGHAVPFGCETKIPTVTPTPTPTPSPSAPAAVQALVGINPCSQANVNIVCAAQAALGVTVDGKYGSGTSSAARALVPNAPAGCSPTPTWWGAKGTSRCGGAPPPQPAPVPGPVTPPPSTTVPAAVQALIGIDPCAQSNSGVVYSAQTALGIKADGKYGSGTSAAARTLIPNAPAPCIPAPSWWGVKGTTQAAKATQDAQTKSAASGGGGAASQDDQAKAAAAAAAAQAADAAKKASQAQTKSQADQAAADAAAAKVAADKAAAQATTQAQADAAAAAAKQADAAATTAAAKGGTAPPPGPGDTTLVTPEKKGLSTGAIVAGAVGAAALVGVVAMAMTGKKGHRGARGRRGPSGHPKHKPSHRRSKRKK